MKTTAEDRIIEKVVCQFSGNEGHGVTCPPCLRAAIHETARQAARVVCRACRTGAKYTGPTGHDACWNIREAFPAAFEGETP